SRRNVLSNGGTMRAFAALLVVYAFGLSPATMPATRSIVVQGIVRDASSTQPIEGASIVAVRSAMRSALGTTSDQNGRYVLRLTVDDAARSVDLLVRRIGYGQVTRHVALTTDSV